MRRCRLSGCRRNASRWRWRGWFHPRSSSSSFLCFFFGFGGSFSLRFGFGLAANLLAHFFSDVRWNRARMRLLFRDAVLRQQVNNGFGLDLELPGQFVDSDLIRVAHALRR